MTDELSSAYLTDQFIRTDISLRNIKRDILAAKIEDMRIFLQEFKHTYGGATCLEKLAEISFWGIKAIEIGE
jgi:hypothetical protein